MDLKSFKSIDQVSASFCLAKWQQVTLHLESGTTHSCHHPKVHKIPLRELKNDPSALHNTKFKMAQRKLMLEGLRPKECSYCWAVEDLEGQHLSDRYLKSAEDWAMMDFEKIRTMNWNQPILPRSLEVSFSRACNLKCSYCSANFSSKWQQEISQFGPYPTGHGKPSQAFYEEDKNPYIDAFWRWWPKLSPHLRVFRITGGEPLLSENTFRVLQALTQTPHKNLMIAVNSNLSVPDQAMGKLLNLAPRVADQVKEFMLYTSLEAWGAQAEYIRNGLDLSRMIKNVEAFLSADERLRVTFMCTLNALSAPSLREFLVEIVRLREKFLVIGKSSRVQVDFSILHNPKHQSIQILPPVWREEFRQLLRFMRTNQFLPHELDKFDRALALMNVDLPARELKLRRGDFYTFFAEHDRRRKTNFRHTFPELTAFFDDCQRLAEADLHYRLLSRGKALYQKTWAVTRMCLD